MKRTFDRSMTSIEPAAARRLAAERMVGHAIPPRKKLLFDSSGTTINGGRLSKSTVPSFAFVQQKTACGSPNTPSDGRNQCGCGGAPPRRHRFSGSGGAAPSDSAESAGIPGSNAEMPCFLALNRIGAKGFEPSTSWSQTRRSNQAELRPDIRPRRPDLKSTRKRPKTSRGPVSWLFPPRHPAFRTASGSWASMPWRWRRRASR